VILLLGDHLVSLTKESLRMVLNLLKLSLVHFAWFLMIYHLYSLIKPLLMAYPMSSSLQVTTSRLSWKRSAYIKPLVQMIFLTGFWRHVLQFWETPICPMFNTSIRQGSVPAIWKCADVIPVLHYIRPYIDSFQFGNTKHCSTTHALIHLLHNWLNALDNSQGVTIRSCMIDFSKAFDKIDHNILLLKLKVIGVPAILLNWCADFLTERNLRVKLGQAKSSWHRELD